MLSQEQRLEEIKEMLAKKHKLTTHELADHFGIHLIRLEEMY